MIGKFTREDEQGDGIFVIKTDGEETNMEIIEPLFEAIEKSFNLKGIVNVGVYIKPELKEIHIKPFYAGVVRRGSSGEGESVIILGLREDVKDEDIVENITFTFTETAMDWWNKYHAQNFLFKYNADKREIELRIDKGLDKNGVKKYWLNNSSDGYNVNGNFWRREWLRDDQKIQTTGGAKL